MIALLYYLLPPVAVRMRRNGHGQLWGLYSACRRVVHISHGKQKKDACKLQCLLSFISQLHKLTVHGSAIKETTNLLEMLVILTVDFSFTRV